jgi:hypothetical protein
MANLNIDSFSSILSIPRYIFFRKSRKQFLYILRSIRFRSPKIFNLILGLCLITQLLFDRIDKILATNTTILLKLIILCIYLLGICMITFLH